MPVIGLNHVNIRTSDVAASAQFYIDIFDFELRRGPTVMGQQPHWLYDDRGAPIIHFRQLDAESESTGAIDHIALSCVGKAAILERLDAKKIKFAVVDNLFPGVTQVFLKDPHGISLELNFTGD
jgi:catechol 2,3-dioxygenase-like lactoylglutathione lyase family enzyme